MTEAPKRHVYWMKPGCIRHPISRRLYAITFGFGRIWVRPTIGKGRCIDLYWPRFMRIGR